MSNSMHSDRDPTPQTGPHNPSRPKDSTSAELCSDSLTERNPLDRSRLHIFILARGYILKLF